MNTSEKTPRNVFVGVDIQNDFIDGSLAVNEGEQTVAPANAVAAAVRVSGGRVAWTRDWHPATTPHFDTWPVHCVQETEGAEFHNDLDIHEEDHIISKGMGQTDGYSGWEGVAQNDGQTLDTLITPQPHERVRVFIGGLATDYCVKATTLDILTRYRETNDTRVKTYLVRDAIRGVEMNDGDTQAALDAMREAGAVAISSAEAIKMIEEML